MSTPVTSSCAAQPWGQVLKSGVHTWHADQTVEAGGQDTGPDPHGLVASALAACTGMTVWMYAKRKAWPLEDVRVEVDIRHEADVTIIARQVALVGSALDATQRARLAAIADKCPIHKLLVSAVRIETVLVTD